jgi:polyhydroxyalkanoate synthesis regulator phasin
MPITEDLRKTLSDPTPFYALAGAGDLAVEKLREVPEMAAAIAGDRRAAQEKATARLQEAGARLTEAQAKVAESVSTLPTDLKSLQEKAQGLALQSVGRAAELAVKAREMYDELAERGKVVVDRQRKDTADELTGIAVKAESKADAFAAEVDQISDTVTDSVIEVAEIVEPEAPAAKPAAKRSTPRKSTTKE